jgi:hypothetical protein
VYLQPLVDAIFYNVQMLPYRAVFVSAPLLHRLADFYRLNVCLL